MDIILYKCCNSITLRCLYRMSIHGFEAARVSLHDIAMDKLRAGNKKRMMDRVFIVSKISNIEKKDKKMVGSNLEKFFKLCQQQLSQEFPSGIMIFYNNHVLSCLECSQEVLMLYLKELEHKFAYTLLESKIMCYTENIPVRMFHNGWSEVCLQPRILESKVETSENIEQVT